MKTKISSIERMLQTIKLHNKFIFVILSVIFILSLGIYYPFFLEGRAAPISITNTFGGGVDDSEEIVSALDNPNWSKYLDSEAVEFDSEEGKMRLAETVSEWEGLGHNISNNDSTIDENPAIYPDSVAGQYFVVWESDVNNLRVQKMDLEGEPMWIENGVSIVSGGTYGDNFDAVSDGNGGIIIAWEDSRDAGGAGSAMDIYAKRIYSNGNQWPVGDLPVSISMDSQIKPRLVSDGAEGALISWYDMGMSRFYVQRINSLVCSGLCWGDDPGTGDPLTGFVIIDKHIGIDSIPMVSDGAGGMIVTWTDNNNVGPLGGFDVYDVYAQRVNESCSADIYYRCWDVRGVKATQPLSLTSQMFPRITTDGSDGVIVFWKYNNKLYSQKINPISCIGDDGRCWDTNGVEISDHDPLASYANYYNIFKTVDDGAGGAVVVWQESGTGIDIYAQKVDTGGVVSWEAGGLPIAVTVGDQERSTINRDSVTGEFHIVWSDNRSGPVNIFTQKVLANGEIGYKDGVSGEDEISGIKLNFDKQSSESNPFVFYNNNGLDGEVILAYADDSSVYPYDVYIQKLGEKDFFLDGVIISSVYDFGQIVNWAPFDILADTPDSSQIYFETRTANDEIAMNDWSDDDWSTPVDIDLGDLNILSSAGRYIQYRLTFRKGSTPILSSITLSGSLPSSVPPPTYTVPEEKGEPEETPVEEIGEIIVLPTICSNTLSEIQATPFPEFGAIWGTTYHPWDDRVRWAYDHRANIYYEYINLLKREPCATEVNWWLQNDPDIFSIRYKILISEEYINKHQ